ncbi:bleomycin resistance protein [Enterococcus faecium]|uniref:Fosfomycin resistance protein FosX protein n=1 Tax=Enterococcus faecium TaxID=1352 RepID=A0AB73N4D2_ENTFC|nr:bleomycin resistance protein [Enterococcus faecium]EGP5556963.1 bleomycin resistance protein [Enterococcus faecium]EGW2154257.1 bleomycin resistance protein [Enterococcus faecium]EKZ0101223.1 hypothetical protein [Enterococcus faecium]MBD9829238.1 hypothetical protein [Enterococcus faecium]OTO00087.1 fosfomycin resistance protein FosX protein [Enterococcus faecium]
MEISHITLIVKDLNKTSVLLNTLFDAKEIDEQDIDSFVSKIQMLGLTVEPGRSRVKGEASSIYFYDYDNHLFELHTGTLQERLKSNNSTT